MSFGSLLSALELPGSCLAREAANGLSWLEKREF